MQVGKRIKRLRINKNMTIKELAQKTEMSVGYISNIEHDINSPTIAYLQKLCWALDTDLASFFNVAFRDSLVIRKEDRQRVNIPLRMKAICELFPLPNKKMVPTYLTIEPGGYYGETPTIHRGDEVCIIIQGTANYQVDDEEHVLHEGDCIYINSMVPHRILNVGKDTLMTFGVKSDE